MATVPYLFWITKKGNTERRKWKVHAHEKIRNLRSRLKSLKLTIYKAQLIHQSVLSTIYFVEWLIL
jgi:hypothetical protein